MGGELRGIVKKKKIQQNNITATCSDVRSVQAALALVWIASNRLALISSLKSEHRWFYLLITACTLAMGPSYSVIHDFPSVVFNLQSKRQAAVQ